MPTGIPGVGEQFESASVRLRLLGAGRRTLTGYRSTRNRQQYDVAPGERRFLMIREPSDAGPGTVVYVENWFAELQAKVRAAVR
jgi:hypothetical protein